MRPLKAKGKSYFKTVELNMNDEGSEDSLSIDSDQT